MTKDLCRYSDSQGYIYLEKVSVLNKYKFYLCDLSLTNRTSHDQYFIRVLCYQFLQMFSFSEKSATASPVGLLTHAAQSYLCVRIHAFLILV